MPGAAQLASRGDRPAGLAHLQLRGGPKPVPQQQVHPRLPGPLRSHNAGRTGTPGPGRAGRTGGSGGRCPHLAGPAPTAPHSRSPSARPRGSSSPVAGRTEMEQRHSRQDVPPAVGLPGQEGVVSPCGSSQPLLPLHLWGLWAAHCFLGRCPSQPPPCPEALRGQSGGGVLKAQTQAPQRARAPDTRVPTLMHTHPQPPQLLPQPVSTEPHPPGGSCSTSWFCVTMTTHLAAWITHTHPHSSGGHTSPGCARQRLAEAVPCPSSSRWLHTALRCGHITPISASMAAPLPSALVPAQPLLSDNYRTPTLSTEPQAQALISRPPAG